ncbi:hypothetical protein FZEAL_3625 [Fusarium zealandicum]|uniref:Uncharacterized protein n=1 Tax=Fusarium zealandicum TaxID=1053134 RepID=A0A8H4UP68_9HYPO|nr:hypothetical protein FZEAL_3625 [Fusarium zealandicum]
MNVPSPLECVLRRRSQRPQTKKDVGRDTDTERGGSDPSQRRDKRQLDKIFGLSSSYRHDAWQQPDNRGTNGKIALIDIAQLIENASYQSTAVFVTPRVRATGVTNGCFLLDDRVFGITRVACNDRRQRTEKVYGDGKGDEGQYEKAEEDIGPSKTHV